MEISRASLGTQAWEATAGQLFSVDPETWDGGETQFSFVLHLLKEGNVPRNLKTPLQGVLIYTKRGNVLGKKSDPFMYFYIY